eukprot:scaffold196_cov193-Skeletonema_dohrnii-CCMP3373.AAC.3
MTRSPTNSVTNTTQHHWMQKTRPKATVFDTECTAAEFLAKLAKIQQQLGSWTHQMGHVFH